MEEPYNQTENDINGARICNCTTQLVWKSPAVWDEVTLTVQWVVFSTALPGLCYAAWRLYALAQPDHVAPVYTINLLLSDLIQISANPIYTTLRVVTCYCDAAAVMLKIYEFGVLGNICFMVCISAERYIMTAHPVWYISINRISTAVLASTIIWLLSAALMIVRHIYVSLSLTLDYILGVILLLPCPLVTLLLAGTWRALSRTSIPRADQRRVIGTLVLVLCIYVVSFLPYILALVLYYTLQPLHQGFWVHLFDSCEILIALNPLFDLLLYVFMRRGAEGICRSHSFCVREDSD